MSASDLVDTLWAIFESVDAANDIIPAVAGLFESHDKRQEVLRAWDAILSQVGLFLSTGPISAENNNNAAQRLPLPEWHADGIVSKELAASGLGPRRSRGQLPTAAGSCPRPVPQPVESSQQNASPRLDAPRVDCQWRSANRLVGGSVGGIQRGVFRPRLASPTTVSAVVERHAAIHGFPFPTDQRGELSESADQCHSDRSASKGQRSARQRSATSRCAFASWARPMGSPAGSEHRRNYVSTVRS